MRKLYEFVEYHLPKDYDITRRTIDENKENTIGIFIVKGTAPQRTSDGATIYDKKIHIEINCIRTDEGIEKASRDLKLFTRSILDSKSNIDGLYVSHVKILDDCLDIGNNEHGIPKLISNLEIKYSEVD